uniref:PiggyBac transposable element n=1 Tax=Trachysalambria curvirostris majanivirus TaxID=2984281 RepID=A0A9C7F735_9VIRU|nr:MAG: piggyBac transposable element [Trachysalambria curvirostris majanivirus]
MGTQKKRKIYYAFNTTEDVAENARSKIHSRYFKLKKMNQEIANDDDSEDDNGIVIDDKLPFDYISDYIPKNIISNLSRGTNMKIKDNQSKGYLADVDDTTIKRFLVDDTTIKRFLGVNLMMSVIKYPQLEMYWTGTTKVSGIADSMSLDKFRNIIRHLQFDYSSEKNHDKSDDKFLKFRPLLDSIQMRCKQLKRPKRVAVAMMVMSFENGFEKIEIMKKNTNVYGALVILVLIAPDGRLLDIEFYQSYDKLIEAVKNTKLDISDYDDLSMGEAAVLRFIKSVHPGTMFFFGEEFTTLRLLDILNKHNMGGTGIIAKKNIPNTVKCNSDKNLDLSVIENGNHCIVSWQSLSLASNVFEVKKPIYEPHTPIYEHYTPHTHNGKNVLTQKHKQSIPNIVYKYNSFMIGVDIFHKLFDHDNSSFSTGKYDVDLILTLINMAYINSWSECRIGYPRCEGSGVMAMKFFKSNIIDSYMAKTN